MNVILLLIWSKSMRYSFPGRPGLSDIKQMIENEIASENNNKFTVTVDEVPT